MIMYINNYTTGVFVKSRTEGIYPCNCTRVCPNMYIYLYIVKLLKLACLNVNAMMKRFKISKDCEIGDKW